MRYHENVNVVSTLEIVPTNGIENIVSREIAEHKKSQMEEGLTCLKSELKLK